MSLTGSGIGIVHTPPYPRRPHPPLGGAGAAENYSKNNRIKELLDLLEDIDGNVIIWAIYRHDIKEITNILSERYGANSVASFFGDTLDRERVRDILLQSPKFDLTWEG